MSNNTDYEYIQQIQKYQRRIRMVSGGLLIGTLLLILSMLVIALSM